MFNVELYILPYQNSTNGIRTRMVEHGRQGRRSKRYLLEIISCIYDYISDDLVRLDTYKYPKVTYPSVLCHVQVIIQLKSIYC